MEILEPGIERDRLLFQRLFSETDGGWRPHYSTSDCDALLVVKAMEGKGYNARIECNCPLTRQANDCYAYCAEYTKQDHWLDAGAGWAASDSLADAITAAALKALEAKS